MNFKKYNFIFVFLLVLIVAIPVVSLSKKSPVDAEEPLPELPAIEIEQEDSTSSSTKREPIKIKDAWSALNYVKSTTLSKSYRTETTQDLTASADLGLGSLDLKQKVIINAFKTIDGKILEETYSSGTKNFFSATYYDGQDAVYSTKSNGSHEVGSRPSGNNTQYTKNDYLNKFGIMPAFIVDVNKSNSEASAYTKSGSICKFTITVKSASAWAGYIKGIEQFSESEETPSIQSISMDFEVSTITGKLLRLTINEKYEITHTGLRVTCTSRSVRTFYDVGKEVALPNLEYLGA